MRPCQILKFGQKLFNLATLPTTLICYHTFCHVVNRSYLLPKPTLFLNDKVRLTKCEKGKSMLLVKDYRKSCFQCHTLNKILPVPINLRRLEAYDFALNE